MQKAEIEAKIKELRAELENARGTPTEVYTRIVGYYRSVKNWNAGKREEYGIRKLFAVPADDASAAKASVTVEVSEREATAEGRGSEKSDVFSDAGTIQAYILFEKDNCPKCPPVKEFMSELTMEGVRHNCDTEEGLNAARRYGVMASPTVIFFDDKSNEVFRAHSVADLRSKLPSVRA